MTNVHAILRGMGVFAVFFSFWATPKAQESVNATDYFPVEPEVFCSRTYEVLYLEGGTWQRGEIENSSLGTLSVPYASGTEKGNLICFLGEVSAWVNDGSRLFTILEGDEYRASDCSFTSPPVNSGFNLWTDGQILKEGLEGIAKIKKDLSACRIDLGGDEFLVKIQDVTVRGTQYEKAVVLWELDNLDCRDNPELPCDQYVAPEPSPKYEEWGLVMPTADEVFQDPGQIGVKVLAIFGKGEGLIAGGEHHVTEGPDPKLVFDVTWELESVSCSSPQMEVVDVPGSSLINAWGVGEDGTIVGSFRGRPSGGEQWRMSGFLTFGESRTDFSFPGSFSTWPNDINRRMEIVGYYATEGTNIRRGFLLSGGSFRSISYNNDPSVDTTVWGNNDQGDLVGFSQTAGGFLWRNGVTTPIAKSGADFARPNDINNHGDIVGSLRDAVGEHGFLLRDGLFEVIDYPGAPRTFAHGINDHGDVVGRYVDAQGRQHGFLRRSGLFRTIDAPCSQQTWVTKINNTGILTGSFVDDSNVQYGFRLSSPGVPDADRDGVSDVVEDGAPNGGDGNSDGLADRDQNNVVSLISGGDAEEYLTLASPAGTSLVSVGTLENPSPWVDAPSGVVFPLGLLEFSVEAIGPGSAVVVEVLVPAEITLDSYYKYGPTPQNQTPHWYEFEFDGTTGAELLAGRILLHFVDGQRGDDDLSANGRLVEPGGPAQVLSSSFLFPQLADGTAGNLQFQSTLILVNTGADTTVQVEFFRSPDGSPMSLTLGGLGSDSFFQFELSKGNSVSLQTPGLESLQVGYARVVSGAGVGGVVVFKGTDLSSGVTLYEAGVPASTPLTGFSIFVDSLGVRDTGVALVYPPTDTGSSPAQAADAEVVVRLYDKQFNLIGQKTLDPLVPGSHVARFVNELFDNPQVKTAAREMEGTLVVVSDRPLVAVTLRQNDDPQKGFPLEVPLLTTFPVIPGAPE